MKEGGMGGRGGFGPPMDIFDLFFGGSRMHGPRADRRGIWKQSKRDLGARLERNDLCWPASRAICSVEFDMKQAKFH